MSKVIKALDELQPQEQVQTGELIKREKVHYTPATGGPQFIPIASGKGGVGKTNISVNLSLLYAQKQPEKHITLIDGDFGLPNADLILGIDAEDGLQDIVNKKTDQINDLQCKTMQTNLFFIPGAKSAMFRMGNLYFQQKEKLIRKIKELQSDVVILDLGAGTNTNVVDFFALIDNGILVTNPEPTSMRDTITFIKNVFIRKLQVGFRGNDYVLKLLHIFDDPKDSRIRSATHFCQLLGRLKDEIDAYHFLKDVQVQFRPKLIVNRVESIIEGLEIASKIRDEVMQLLGVTVDYLGPVFEDSQVVRSVKQSRPFIVQFPQCKASRSLEQVVRRLINNEVFSVEKNVSFFGGYLRKFFGKD